MSLKPKPAEMVTPAEVPAPSEAVSATLNKPVDAIVNNAIDATLATLKETAARATVDTQPTQERVKQGMEKAMKTSEELVAFGQGNAEALVKSGQIWAAGMQDLSKQFAATAQASFEEAVATFKAMTSVKSLKDAMDLQASFARAAMEKSMAESSKLTDASFKLTEQALAPITARMTLAVEKFAKAA